VAPQPLTGHTTIVVWHKKDSTMKKLNILSIILVIISLISCEKDKNGDSDNQKIDFRFVINLQNNKLISYSKYDNAHDSLLYQVNYDYNGNYIIERKLINNVVGDKHKYIVENGIAVESFDTIYNNDSIIAIYYFKYYHTNGRLSKKETVYKRVLTDTIEIYNQVNEYSYSEDGNLISRSIESDIGYGDFRCWDSFMYTDKKNVFDVNHFNSKITGEISNNLISTRIYNNGCPGGPSYIFPTSKFDYVINNSGYVDVQTETFISGYAADTTITRTKFEYDIK
jgi:hypothetical protein